MLFLQSLRRGGQVEKSFKEAERKIRTARRSSTTFLSLRTSLFDAESSSSSAAPFGVAPIQTHCARRPRGLALDADEAEQRSSRAHLLVAHATRCAGVSSRAAHL